MAKVKSDLRIRNSLGLHARAASLFAQTASNYQSVVTVTREGTSVDGKSILSLMCLSASRDSVLTVCAEGEDAQDALNALQELVEASFNE